MNNADHKSEQKPHVRPTSMSCKSLNTTVRDEGPLCNSPLSVQKNMEEINGINKLCNKLLILYTGGVCYCMI